MNVVKVLVPGSPYCVYIGDDILERMGMLLRKSYKGNRLALVTHKNLFFLYGKKIVSQLKRDGFRVESFFVPQGEKSKCFAELERFYNFLASNNFQRDSAVLAVGGGVIGDLAGYGAATYMRGVALFHVPTTVVAQADSSIGGKTGVNHPSAKNLIGAFYQPRAVFCDVRVLKTLPQREYVSGLAEVVKYGMIYDSVFLSFLEKHTDDVKARHQKILAEVIKRCVEIKGDVVRKDEKEKNLRMILNYGHTMGHALETSTDYTSLLHGEAVAWGMVFAARLSCEHCGFPLKAEERQNALLNAFSLLRPLKKPKHIKSFLNILALDKKARKGRARFVLLKDIGKTCVADDVPSSLLMNVAAETLWNGSV